MRRLILIGVLRISEAQRLNATVDLTPSLFTGLCATNHPVRQEEEVMEMSSTNRFQLQLDESSESALRGKPFEFPVDDGLRNMAAVLAL